jgi:hypothetical protein
MNFLQESDQHSSKRRSTTSVRGVAQGSDAAP